MFVIFSSSSFSSLLIGHKCEFLSLIAEQDRTIIFKEPRANMAMEGHVISTGEVPSEGSCRVKCYMEPNCVSINIGLLKEGKFKCELNDATDENEFAPALKYKASYTYLAIEVHAFLHVNHY